MKTIVLNVFSEEAESKLNQFLSQTGDITISGEEDYRELFHDIRNPLSALNLQSKLIRKLSDEGRPIANLNQRLEKIELLCAKINGLMDEFVNQRSQNSYKTSPQGFSPERV
jgi:uncharacterized protein YicC (UPF0701 family)